MDYMQQLQRFEIILEWLDNKASQLVDAQTLIPIGDRYAELDRQLSAVNDWYDEVSAERNAIIVAEKLKVDAALAEWKAAQRPPQRNRQLRLSSEE